MTDLRSPNPVLRSFPTERIAVLRDMEERHFWFKGRRRLVLSWLERALPRRGALVVDIGCGTGSLIAHLARRGYRALGVDPLGGFLPRQDRDSRLLWGDACALPIQSGTCDAVLLLDVLEHTDDRLALDEARRVLRPSGAAILTVPAQRWLWSTHDERAGHLRRYSRSELFHRVRAAGFDVEGWQYYQCLLLPLIAWSRLTSGGRGGFAAERRQWAVLEWITSAELFLGQWLRWPVGSTLIVVCRAPAIGDPSDISHDKRV
jgi:SAM-dependent methyltransferase